MSKIPPQILAGVSSALLLALPAASAAAREAGTDTITITNVPTLGGSSLAVYGLNAKGQITGWAYTLYDWDYHAFLDDQGTMIDLGTLGGSGTIGFAANNAGQVVGQADLTYSWDSYTMSHAFLYDAGTLQDLGTLGGSSSAAVAINDLGQIAGYSYLAGDWATAAFVYANGSMTSLGTLGGINSYAKAINGTGAVAGWSSVANGNKHGFVYSGGTMVDIGTLGGISSSAVAINDAGAVVGESTTAAGETHGVVYAGGVLTDVGTLGGTYSTAYGINGLGQVIGYATTANDQETHGFIYSRGALTDLGSLGGGQSQPAAINNLGAVVGRSTTSGGVYHAFLYQNGQMADLNTLLPADSGWELSNASFLNDSGRIVGIGTYYGASQYFVMDVPMNANHPPVAVAGPDQTVSHGTQVTLDGSQSSDPDNDPLTYEWSLGGTVLGTTVKLVVSLPMGANVLTLKVTDPSGASAQANVTITVVDNPPVAVAGPDQTVSYGAQVTLDGSQSSDPDNDPLTYAWSLGGTVLGTTAKLVVSLPMGANVVTLKVTDPSGESAQANVTITVVDTTAPVIQSLSASPNVLSPANHQLVPVTVSAVATDNCDAAPVSKIISVVADEPVSAGDITITGDLTVTLAASKNSGGGARTYFITVQCTDASGNSSTAVVTVAVPQNNSKKARKASPRKRHK